MRRPDFVIIGAMKCATSTLHAQLGAQPGIYMSEPKEPNFFGDDEAYARGFEWYESLFASARFDWLCGESSTHYSKRDEYPRACERLHQHDPDLRIVYVMRHPVARLVSHYRHGWTEGTIRSSLDQAVLEHPELTLQSCYAWQLAPYLKRFGSDRILPVFFERLARWPRAELERIARHVGFRGPVHWSEDLGAYNRSAERRRRGPLLETVRRVPGARSAARLLPGSLVHRMESRWKMPEAPSLSTDAEQRLQRIFDRDLERLGRWLGTRLSCSDYEATVCSQALEWSSAAQEAA